MDKGLTIGLLIALVAILVIGGWWLWMNGISNPIGQYNSTETSTTPTNNGQGTVFFSVADAALNMSTISSVDMTVDKASLHNSSGWIAVSDVPQTFSLLSLRGSGKIQLLAKANVNSGTYDQVWLHISKVTVTESGTVKEVAMPSGDLRLIAQVNVKDGTGTSVKTDVLTDWSLHKTAKGEFIFAPVVNFESRSGAGIQVGADNMVVISGGTTDASVSSGMDVNGQMKTDFKLDVNAPLQINNDIIQLNGNSQSGASLY